MLLCYYAGKTKSAAIVAIFSCLRFEPVHRKSDPGDGQRLISDDIKCLDPAAPKASLPMVLPLSEL